jgi:hypothetical protein
LWAQEPCSSTHISPDVSVEVVVLSVAVEVVVLSSPVEADVSTLDGVEVAGLVSSEEVGVTLESALVIAVEVVTPLLVPLVVLCEPSCVCSSDESSSPVSSLSHAVAEKTASKRYAAARRESTSGLQVALGMLGCSHNASQKNIDAAIRQKRRPALRKHIGENARTRATPFRKRLTSLAIETGECPIVVERTPLAASPKFRDRLPPVRFLLAAALLIACTTESAIDRAKSHFDPPSGTVFAEKDAVVHVVGLDDVAVCFSVDGEDPGYGETCKRSLDESRAIELECGFHNVAIRWGNADELESSSYHVETAACGENEGVTLWQNDELVRAFAAIKDALQCRMNNCENPSLPGTWSADCGDGQVQWEVSLDGFRAISVFTYTQCRASTTISIHDPADESWSDPEAIIPLDVELVLNGEMRQDTDFSGNGDEAGTVAVTGDFVGEVTSLITITDKARGGGGFVASCSEGPLENEICAPQNAAIRYDFPDWTCHTDVCPK